MAFPDIPAIEVGDFDFHVLPMQTRFPFQYGIASMTHLPHLMVRVRMKVGGKDSVGVACEGLAPKWFTKNPDTTFEEDLPAMLESIRSAAGFVSGESAASFFEFWLRLNERQKKWAGEGGVPFLLASLGSSLVERAVMDGVCRGLETPFFRLVRENALGIEAGEVDGALGNFQPADLLPAEPRRALIVRHTVGLGDPLTEGDVAEPMDDGLPYSLEESIREYGLRYFKIKLCGIRDRDRDRLIAIRKVLEEGTDGNYHITLDGNEQFRDIGSFRARWEELVADSEVQPLFDHLLFVEQPLHRDVALGDSVGDSLSGWEGAPPVIIDESDAELDSLPRALSLGYSGTSHKNCKGVVKGILNAMRIEKRRRDRPDLRSILSAEDLANVGPVALLQDLAVVATLGIPHVERNGHHYFKGLSAFPESVQEKMIECHPGLYRRDEGSFPTLRINEGELHIKSVVEAPFGTGFLLDVDLFEALDPWLSDS